MRVVRDRQSAATGHSHAFTVRRLGIRTVAALLAATLLSLGLGVGAASPASAVFATGGAGRFPGSINWFTWGAAGTGVGAGTYTNDTTVAGSTLRVTCTISNLTYQYGGYTTPSLYSYVSGTWQGDSFDNLYNIGGVGSSNTMAAGLMVSYGNQATFNFSCGATLDGVVVPLQGLVMADAEASNMISSYEWIGATPNPATATWRLIDRYNNPYASCSTTALARLNSTSNRLFLLPDKNECLTGTPSGVLFMDGATSATSVVLKGGGVTAIALGVVISTDFGDAPASYGPAGSLFEPTWTGGTLSSGDNPIANGASASTTPISMANQVAPTQTLLGTRIDAEPASWTSAGATGDDTHGIDDEDAIGAPGAALVDAGQTYDIANVACTGPGYVSGWIDWNGNGVFDAGERSGVVQCTGSSVDLSWAVPADVKTTATSFLRLRIAGTSAAAGVATGMTIKGEVEDYPIEIRVARPGIKVIKSADTSSVVGSAPVTYTYTVTNTGTEPLKPVALSDDKCAGPAFVSGDTDNDSALDTDETWNYSCTQTLSYPTDAPSVTNIATATGTGVVSGDPTSDTDQVTVTVSPSPAAINATKSGVEVQAAQPFDGTFIATYTVSVTNSGQTSGSYGPLTDTPAFSSALTVLGASWTTTGSGVPAGGSATGAGPFTLAAANTSLAAGATHTYTVVVKLTYAGTAAASACGGTAGNGLFNSVSLPSGQEADTSDNSACLPPPSLNQGVTVAKSSVPPDGDSVAPGSTVAYTISFTSTGSVGSYIDYVDHLAKVLDDASLDTASFASSSAQVTGTYVEASQSIRISGYVSAGETVTFSYTVTVDQIDDLGDADLVNVVAPSGEEPPTVCEPDDSLCTEHPVPTPSLTLKKDIVGRGVASDQFTLVIERLGEGADPVTLDSATTSGGSTGVQEDATATAPRAVPGMVYAISETGAGTTNLATYGATAVCLTGDGTSVATTPVEGMVGAWQLAYPAAVAGASEVGSVTCTIANEPLYTVQVSKLGRDCDVGQPTCVLAGAEFAIYDGDPTVGGVLITDGIAADPVDGSLFASVGLAAGEFWLVETRAPAGFGLLASPIKFALSASGVTLAEPGTSVSVDAEDPFRIQVWDVTAAALPRAGGEGWWPFLGFGLALLGAAAVVSIKSSRAACSCVVGGAGVRSRDSRNM